MNSDEMDAMLSRLEQSVEALVVRHVARMETLARLLESDPHQYGPRPCQTCTAVSAILERPFGCCAKGRR